MLTTLPTELVLQICEEIPAGGLKVVRLVCRDLNDLLRPKVMSAVAFNIHRDNLDLTLLENLAEEDDVGKGSTPVASLVRHLTIYSLSPPYSVKVRSFCQAKTHVEYDNLQLDGGPRAIRLQKHSTRLDSLAVAACEKRLLNVLGRSLHALKNITHLKYAPQ
ncbi:hypothetical protein BJ165DRAFT_1498800 [Panaeolus papilionaceus]|nr:hypothetical protein BJ165DRAFT_1498800 [Panaeolus papilionaceus]